MMIQVLFFLLANARDAPHPFRAESNHLCQICTTAVTSLQKTSQKDLGDIDQHVLSFCHQSEDMDCTAACQMLVDELESGEMEAFYGSPEEVCLRHNWCEPEGAEVEKHDMRRLLGAIVDPEIRCKLHNVVDAPEGFEAPASFDSAANWPQCAKTIGDIRDQSNCGCCWAFAAAEAASDRLCISSNATHLLPLSAEQMCFCAPLAGMGCNGGSVEQPWDHIKNYGLVTGGQVNGTGPFGSGLCIDFTMPHCHHHGPVKNDPYPAEGDPGCPSQSSDRCPRTCDASAKSPHDKYSQDFYNFKGQINSYSNEKAIQAALMQQGPIETAFTVYKDFGDYDSGIYVPQSTQQLGGHAVKFVGWGEENSIKYWKVANSWNPYWGESGYFRIIRGRNSCGIESQGAAGYGTWGPK